MAQDPAVLRGLRQLPVADINVGKTKVIPNRRGDVKPGVLVEICFGR